MQIHSPKIPNSNPKKKKKTTPINFHKHPEFQSKWVQQQSNPQQKRIEIWSNSFKTKSNSKP